MTYRHRCFVFMFFASAVVFLANPAGARHEANQPQAPMAGMDHSKMAPATPAPVRQITGPAEAALQAFQDALQVGNRDLATQRLAPAVTVVEGGVTDSSREAYANRRMRSDMEFLKASKVMLLDRQVRDAGDSTEITSTSRITGRIGETRVDITSKEVAQLRKTADGWIIVRLERSSEPADDAKMPAGAATAAPMDHSKMAMGGATPAAPGAKPVAAGMKPAAAASMDHSKMAMSGTTPAAVGPKPAAAGTKPAAAAPMDHSKMAMGTGDVKPADSAAMTIGEAKLPVTAAERVMDPACPNADTKTAPKAVHERRVYYFCSVKDRDGFLKDPVAYLKKQPR